jgi:hypothetical protein
MPFYIDTCKCKSTSRDFMMSQRKEHGGGVTIALIKSKLKFFDFATLSSSFEYLNEQFIQLNSLIL